MVVLVVGTAVNNPEEAKVVLVVAGVGLFLYFRNRVKRGRDLNKRTRDMILDPNWSRRSAVSSTRSGWHSTLNTASYDPLEQILALTATEFEEFTVALLFSLGFSRLRRIGGAGDLGVDVIGVDPHGRTTVVQCKRYGTGTRVGSPLVQHFLAMKYHEHRDAPGLIVTTSAFTRPAIDLARRNNIELIDGRRLLQLLEQGKTDAIRGANASGVLGKLIRWKASVGHQ